MASHYHFAKGALQRVVRFTTELSYRIVGVLTRFAGSTATVVFSATDSPFRETTPVFPTALALVMPTQSREESSHHSSGQVAWRPLAAWLSSVRWH